MIGLCMGLGGFVGGNVPELWGASGIYLGLLVAATACTSLFATWCFRAYQRSI